MVIFISRPNQAILEIWFSSVLEKKPVQFCFRSNGSKFDIQPCTEAKLIIFVRSVESLMNSVFYLNWTSSDIINSHAIVLYCTPSTFAARNRAGKDYKFNRGAHP